ncbi:SDR family oxidoreductase [Cutibacterium sp. WCA-380-WT-3A]|uniref:SDR family oxidoreductase n=1 Tax=Cutibacterium porci TaxID=2605781 RepID=A0A7K0J7N6_9ACTN|nr:SDR family oxidoreductase [Cutibacterium porci]MSS45972.1 SDR family oxidoreductase [Cutibacterium porci]
MDIPTTSHTSRSNRDTKTVLVTGATRGIGRAIAEDLGRDHHIIVGGRHRDAVDKVVSALPDASPFIADLADEEATAAAVSRLHHLDVLVNSAGVAAQSPIASQSRDEWRRVLEINVIAVADLTRLVLPLLRASHGDVVMINSGSGFLRTPAGGGLYAASKYALRALTHALREEERGVVRVTSIHPGRVDTDMQVELQAQSGRPYVASEHLRPQSVAAAVRAALEASPEAMIEELSIRPVFRN